MCLKRGLSAPLYFMNESFFIEQLKLVCSKSMKCSHTRTSLNNCNGASDVLSPHAFRPTTVSSVCTAQV